MNNRGHISRTVCFGGFEIDREACELRQQGQRIPLQIQPFRVLEALIDRAGEVVTRADLRARIWPTTVFVDFDHGLNSAMTRLRHALGDSSGAPSFIETIPRIGYRFIHAIERDDVDLGSLALVEPHADSSRRTWAAVASALLIGVLGTAVWRLDPGDHGMKLAETPESLQTGNLDAREAYLRGLDFFEQRNKEAIERSIVQLKRATEADPDFAMAHAALAMAYVSAGGNNSLAKYRSADDVLGPALAAAERALQLDPELAQAHWALAGVLNGLQPWSAATDVAIEQAYERALDLDPRMAGIRLYFGNFLSTRGRNEEAITRYREALELDPLSPSINSRLGMELVTVGQTEAGLEYLRKTVELDPWQFNAQWRLGWAYVALEDLDAAESAFEAAERVSPNSVRSKASLAYVTGRKGDEEHARAMLSSLRPLAEALDDPFDIAIVYVGLRDRENSLEWIARTARQTRTLHMQGPWGIHAPMFDWLRGDARFVAIESEIEEAKGGVAPFDPLL
jgi:DNA-binding winged helix-turn-helix (wHTH) protein/Tfp pilus assembly protein PilF